MMGSARWACGAVIGMALALAGQVWAAADSAPASPAQPSVKTNILAKIYEAGNGRLSRGDAAGAMSVFQIVQDAAPQLPEANYALALASVLADFGHRERALDFVRRGHSLDPNNPIGTVIGVFADPSLSVLRSDGALYVSPAAAGQLRGAAQEMENYPSAPNAKYAAEFLGTMENTGDAAYPQRIAKFSRMVGQGGVIRLPNTSSDVAFGQLFSLKVSDERFAPYEQNIIRRLQDGLRSLETSQNSLSRVRERIQQLRARLDSPDPTDRVAAMANLDTLLSNLDDIITQNDATIASLKLIVDSVGTDQALVAKRQELQREEQKVAQLRSEGRAIDQALSQKKAAVSKAEQERLEKVQATEEAQRRLDAVEKRLADAETQLKASDDTTAQAERTLRQRNQQLAQLAAQEDQLRKQQAAAAQLDSIRQEQNAAAAQLNQLRAEIQSAEASKQGDLASLHQQESDLSAKVASLRTEVAAGEKAREQAQQVEQQLASLQAQKSGLAGEVQSEQANVDRLRAEHDALQREVEAMRRDQEKQVAESARLAEFTKEVNFGRYFALVIGNDEYQQWPKLKTAVNDAKDISAVLEAKYGFKVRTLLNATRAQIINALDDYIDEVGPNDNLLIYYAGHGIIDGSFGYWVPVDGDAYVPGRALRTENLIRHEDIIASIQKLHAKQVILIADSCFAGGLTALAQVAQVPATQPATQQVAMRGFRLVGSEGGVDVSRVEGTVAQADEPSELIAMQHLASRAARVVLTSGGNEPVVDQLKAGDRHSVFAQALLRALQSNKNLMKSIELTNQVEYKVAAQVGTGTRQRGASGSAVEQLPSYSNLLGYNGEFLFVARN